MEYQLTWLAVLNGISQTKKSRRISQVVLPPDALTSLFVVRFV
jgi:hypothetical protein